MIRLGYNISIMKWIWDRILESSTAPSFVKNLSRALWTNEEIIILHDKNKISLRSMDEKKETLQKMQVIKCKHIIF